MADESAPEPKELPRVSAVVADAAQEISEPVQGPTVRESSWNVPDAAERAPASAPSTRTDADVPWWLMDSRGPSISPADHWQPKRTSEPVQPASVAQEIEPQLPPAWSWENASLGSGDFRIERAARAAAAPAVAEEAAPKPAPQIANEESSYETESRLNGLRGLLFSMGLKNLSKTKESAGEESVLPADDEQERTVLARRFTPFADPEPAAVPPAKIDKPSVPARSVVAKPEFLPPKEFTPIK